MLFLKIPFEGTEGDQNSLFLCPSGGTLVVALGLQVQDRGPHLCTQKVLEIRVLGIEFLFVCGELPLPERKWKLGIVSASLSSAVSCAPSQLLSQITNTMLWQHLAVCPCRVHLLALESSDYLYRNNKQC